MTLQIDNPTIESYFQDSKTIERILEFIAINKISINNQKDSTISEDLSYLTPEIQKGIDSGESKESHQEFMNRLKSKYA